MASFSLSEQAAADVCSLLDAVCTGESTGIPCASVVVVGTDPQPEIFAHSTAASSGERGRNICDDIYWLASCTKLVTSIACMQLVEGAILRLDDADQLESLCPELVGLKVVQEDGSLEPARSRITLRMLLTHTGI